MDAQVEQCYLKGISALSDGNWLMAVRYFRKCLEHDKGFITAYIELADIFYHNGQLDAALIEIKSALMSDPKDEEANFMLGRIYLSRGSYKEALRVFKRLEIGSPGFGPDLCYFTGVAYRNIGYPDLALDYFNLALKDDPSYFECIDEIARLHFEAGRYNDAQKAFIELIDADPANVSAHHMLALAYSKQSMWKDAIRECETVLSLSPDMDEALREMGWALNMTGDYEKSVSALKKAIEMNPGNLQARIDLGAVFISNLKLDEAISELELAKKDDPGNPLIKKFLSDAHTLNNAGPRQGKD